MVSSPTAENVSYILSELREEKGLSQIELAKMLNVDYGTSISREKIAKWETKQQDFKSDEIRNIADFFGVSADYLLGLTPNPTTDKDLNAVCEYVGLSQESVELLAQLKRIDENNELSVFFESETGKAFLNSIIEFGDNVKENAMYRAYLANTSDEPFISKEVQQKRLIDEILEDTFPSMITQYEILAYRITKILQRYFDDRAEQILKPVKDFEIQKNDELVKEKKELKDWLNKIVEDGENNG